MHRCASMTFAVLLVGASSGCALPWYPGRETLEKADYGPPPQDCVGKIARHFERRYGKVPQYIEFMGPMKGWWRKSGYFFSTDYRYGWRVNIRTHERFYRFYFRANAIVKVTVSNQDC